ncbi:helix-turn-helix transcriptional regulator [Lysinibacillus varians]|uniref:WYL domain-containing protein n=1 Tax=Lysinibacillus varians TaxID=1145276 RepID=A0ABY2TA10_9BACI|nr:WYL domain-containing protein [Lysinibacillus varians]AHN22171.1 hypothetical protein T479_13225 [Lysinibacillus varians]TKI51921.1 WYL domain-containing protein [Lysinibacillus varians]
MVDSQQNKGYRVISMFDRLMDGQGISKKQEAFTHQVGEKTIQRDLDQIRAYIEKAKLDCHLEYVRTEKVYKLTNTGKNVLSIVAADKQEFIHNIILNEKHLYVDLNHKKSLLHLIWVISEAIQKKKIIKIDYLRESEIIPSQKILKPLGVIFSEYYFYLIAYDSKHEKDLPIVYRIDRIQHFLELDKKFQIPYSERFQEGEFRKRIQFMDAGELMHIKFLFKGRSPQAVLDRLPTAKILSNKDGQCLFEAEVFGRGIKMWLLSQGANIEVLEPLELREEMIETIQSMQQNYFYM